MYFKLVLLSPLTLCLAGFTQAPSSVNSAGPTMQQTVKFLSDMLEKQGVLFTSDANSYSFRSGALNMEGECSLVITDRMKTSSRTESAESFRGTIIVLDLSRSEPASVAIAPIPDATPQVFSLNVNKAYREVRSTGLPRDNSPAVPISQGEEITGYIQSNASGNLLLVTAEGQLRSYAPPPKTKWTIYRDGNDAPATLSDALPGDTVIIRSKSKTITLFKHAPQQLKGYGGVTVATVSDQETANRMAKALIHALVLCHRNEEPQPF